MNVNLSSEDIVNVLDVIDFHIMIDPELRERFEDALPSLARLSVILSNVQDAPLAPVVPIR